MLKIGRISYSNCTPIFHVLSEIWDQNNSKLISGVPSSLNSMLQHGEIDVCPCSSIEYALHSERYAVLPNISISSNGAVASVLLFSKIPIERLDGKTIILTSESATSVNLLKILLTNFIGIKCTFQVGSQVVLADTYDVSALMLIGDSALQVSAQPAHCYVYDLGALWYEWTGLPFVFALWICRVELAGTPEIRSLSAALVKAKSMALSHIDEIAKCYAEPSFMGFERLSSYWRNNISYDLDEQHIKGLMLFYQKAYELNLLDTVPVLRFAGE